MGDIISNIKSCTIFRKTHFTTLPKTNIPPWEIGHPKKESIIFQSHPFSGATSVWPFVSGRLNGLSTWHFGGEVPRFKNHHPGFFAPFHDQVKTSERQSKTCQKTSASKKPRRCGWMSPLEVRLMVSKKGDNLCL